MTAFSKLTCGDSKEKIERDCADFSFIFYRKVAISGNVISNLSLSFSSSIKLGIRTITVILIRYLLLFL